MIGKFSPEHLSLQPPQAAAKWNQGWEFEYFRPWNE